MIRTQAEVYGVAIGATLLTVVAVAGSVALEYPMEMWRDEFLSHITLPACFMFISSYILGKKSLQVSELSEELQALVRRDRLTEAATRDFFFQQMEAAPDNSGVSLMIDIDHFKSVNDTFGHFAGDQVIRGVAERLREHCRKGDIFCRFGGEEFVVFLNRATGEQGEDVAERMRREIEGNPVVFEGREIGVTVSIGAALKDARDDVNAAIRVADDALYKAKAAGRNRVVLAWRRRSYSPAA